MASSSTRKATLLRSLLLAMILASFSPPFLFVCAKIHKPFQMPKEDPYKVLGIKQKDRNNTDAIKRAYREKAKAAHPDKNLDLDPEIANQRFHRVVEAWDILSDPQKKHNYDTRSRHQKPRNNNSNRNFNRNRNVKIMTQKVKPTQQKRTEEKQQREERQRREREEKTQQKGEQKRMIELARQAQDNVRKISSLKDLFDAGVVDESTQQFTKNFLCVFVSNKKIEKIADEQILFPYPFGPKGRNGIDWGDVIQTAKVRFNKATPLTKAFNVPANLSAPYIVFVRKGDLLGKSQFNVYSRSARDPSKPYAAFEKWMMNMLTTRVTIKNRNPEGGPAIKIFIDGDHSTKSDWLSSAGTPLKAGYQRDIFVKLSDRLVILDASTNEFFGPGVSNLKNIHLTKTLEDMTALDVIVVKQEAQVIHVGNGHGTTRICHDLSTRCHSYIHEVNKNACRDSPGYTHAICAKSCGVCIDSPYFNGLHYAIMHMPPHKVPPGLRKVVDPLRESARFVQTVAHDFSHIWEVRRNVAFAFVVGGLLLGVQLVLLARMLMRGLVVRATTATASGQPDSGDGPGSSSPAVLLLLMVATFFVATTLVWLSNASKLEVPSELWGFHDDLLFMLKMSVDLVFDLFCLGFASLLVTKILTYRVYLRRSEIRLFHHVVFLVSMVSITAVMVFGFGIAKEIQATDASRKYKLSLWKKIWDLRKNAAVAVIGFGQLLGATAMAFIQFAKHRTPMRYLFATLVNIGVGCGLLSLTLLDPYFLHDLDHVVRMRMSAAIPCLVGGMLAGLFGAHLWFATRETQPQHSAHDTKVKSD